MISGALHYTMPIDNDIKTLDEGSYFGATSKAMHSISNASEHDIVLYVRTNGNIKIH